MSAHSSSSSAPLVFLDTCVFSAAARGDQPSHTSAISVLLDSANAGVIHAIASSRVRDELARIPVKYRAPHLAALSRTSEFPKSLVTWLETRADVASIQTDSRYRELSTILSGSTDPALVVDALDAGARYWITVDKKTVLSKRSALQSLVPIEVLDPSECVQALGLSSSTGAV
jgi:predicted nucleic acid-binding protein